MHVVACGRGSTNTVRECALKVDWEGKKSLNETREPDLLPQGNRPDSQTDKLEPRPRASFNCRKNEGEKMSCLTGVFTCGVSASVPPATARWAS